MESKHCSHLIARGDARSVSVIIVSMVLLLLSGPVLVKGQGGVYLFGDNVTLPCVSATSLEDEQFLWRDDTDSVVIYSVTGPDDNAKTTPAMGNEKYNSFGLDNNYPTDVNLLINLLDVKDAGSYSCNFIGQDSPPALTVDVEAMPISVSISCARSSSTDCPSPSSPTSDSFSCNCTAIGAYPNSLQFEWSGGATGVQQSSSSSTKRNDTFDFDTNAEIVPTENLGSVTCTLNGYNQTWEGVRHAAYNFHPPMCELKSICNETNTGVSLTCTCTDASPDEGLVYSFYRDGLFLSSGNTNVLEAAIEMDQEYTFGCRGCNGVNYGSASYVEEPVRCQESTTALPTTTITTVPLSTNEPTSTKATDATTSTMHTEDSTMETTTEEPNPKGTDNPGPSALGTGAIVGIIVGVVAVVIVIVVIAVIMCKKGKCGSKSESSSVADGNVTATNSNITSSEPPAPVYGVVKKDSKKKSDKPDKNGAGPRVDPEIPTYGTNDKNMTKDQAPAPHSSMRDSTNSSKPKQDMEMQYADLDHGNKPPSDEVRKPKKEPTEYATVQPVIV